MHRKVIIDGTPLSIDMTHIDYAIQVSSVVSDMLPSKQTVQLIEASWSKVGIPKSIYNKLTVSQMHNILQYIKEATNDI